MKIEHFGLVVPEPLSMAKWYEEHLGFQIKRSGGDNTDGVAFVADSSGQVMLELIARRDTRPLDFAAMPPLQVHLALLSDDPAADCDRLQEAGAVMLEDNLGRGSGDRLILLRDPWGMVIQLVKRKTPIIAL
jgi:catechol 2,3-dioxygenase-like lactoylglutathione lyase family enzyme